MKLICYARLPFAINIRELQMEIQNIQKDNDWISHYNQLHYTGDWKVLPLRAPGGDSSNPFAELIQQNSFKDTPLLEVLPEVKHLLNNLECEKYSVRLLNLKAGAVIKQHRDYELAFEKGEARLHFPIFTNESVEFYVENNQLHMQEGECWYINANLMHRVANYGIKDRIHLVVDCKVNFWLKKMFEQSEVVCKTEKIDRELQIKIIESLRMHNTQTASAMADKLEKELNDE